ncbi:hypothetical protein BU15DRAFT_63733 [Melanogaster broomeanus]|nr:hypothetical protein BU15DRAFT_63733 [Melanogaster broomeanus]
MNMHPSSVMQSSSPLVTGGLPPADANLAQSSPPSDHSAPPSMSTSPLPDPVTIPPPVPVPVISCRGTSLPTDSPVSMNIDPIPSEGCSSLPTGDATPTPSPLQDPSRPVPLPMALGVVIGQAITDRLDAATAGHPEPRGHDSDDDGDGEYAAVPQRWKKPGPRGKMNRLHKALCDYLRQKKIIPSGSKGELPASALADTVLAFNQDGASPPSLENIALDWSCCPLTSSRWNSEAIAILTLDFYNHLKAGAYQGVIFDEHSMNLPGIRKICEQKLTFARRQKIVMQNRSRDPEKWDAIHKIIDRLGVEGMSGDETDSPPFSRPKVLQCLELPWINPGISCLFKSMETYESALRTENMLEQIGNSSLKRHWEAGRKEVKSTTIPGLPRNWFNHWACLMLSVRKDVDIPALHVITFQTGIDWAHLKTPKLDSDIEDNDDVAAAKAKERRRCKVEKKCREDEEKRAQEEEEKRCREEEERR